jgi:hypothetical protein
LSDETTFVELIHNENELIVVVAVQHFDVHSRVGHSARELSELPRHCLSETLNHDVTDGEHANSRCRERVSRFLTVGEEKMSDAATINDPRPAAFDAHACSSERFSDVGKRTPAVFELD